MTDEIQVFYDARPYPTAFVGRESSSGGANPAAALIHHVFGGELSKERPLRVLVAGGGAGIGLAALARTLDAEGISATLTYLDISAASREVARRRLEGMGFSGVTYRLGAIEDLSREDPGQFDYVDVTGVLNHVKDAEAAVQSLAHVTAADGGIGGMVYGAVGRTGVYHVQELIRLLHGPEATVAEARRVLMALPDDNWLRKSPLFEFLRIADDTELADALLNPRDRAFTTMEVENMFGAAGMLIRTFVPSLFHDPAAMMKDQAMKVAARALDPTSARRVAELFSGTLFKLNFFASKIDPAERIDRLLQDDETVLIPSGTLHLPPDTRTESGQSVSITIKVSQDGVPRALSASLTAYELELARRMRTRTTIGALRAGFQGEDFEGAFAKLRRLFGGLDLLYLRSGR